MASENNCKTCRNLGRSKKCLAKKLDSVVVNCLRSLVDPGVGPVDVLHWASGWVVGVWIHWGSPGSKKSVFVGDFVPMRFRFVDGFCPLGRIVRNSANDRRIRTSGRFHGFGCYW